MYTEKSRKDARGYLAGSLSGRILLSENGMTLQVKPDPHAMMAKNNLLTYKTKWKSLGEK